MKPGTKPWTSEEEDLLRQEVLAGTPIRLIASKMDRSEPAIRSRAYALRLMLGRPGVTRRGMTKWH